jgi:hypothetical protein
MKTFQFTSSTLKLFGYIVWGLGVWHFAEDHIARYLNYTTYSPAYGVADEALVLAGAVALIAAQCIKKIEVHLAQIENG